MVCLELGQNMAELARHNLAAYPNVAVVHSAFETWPLEQQAFDLVFAAEAWHWIAPEEGYARAAALLSAEGTLALCWNQQPVPDTPFYRALVSLYEEKAPPPLLVAHPDPDGLIAETVAAIDATGLFGKVTVRVHWWTATYTAEQYLKLLNTYSMYRRLAPDVRQTLLAAVFDLVQAFGGEVERPYRAVLYVARRATGA
jgi:hypothetical protein